MIHLDHVSKTYPGVDAAAIEGLSLEVLEGEIVVLLGPSGCGKTTTMRMINRMIEPTSGRIIVDGEDVTDVNADHLRRRIGYVIQQIGLLPHLTVAANIAMVPKALGWEKDRIRDRVAELLDLLGLGQDFAHRYPKQLSGGQQQRVGVARALAADPPVMLMDEPFGALDPIIRDRLQDEFLALQETIHKTVVFVTHDIEEAIKLGDRIAIFSEGGTIAQYDTPARLLTEPANEFVESFIGAGGSVRLLGLHEIAKLPLTPIEVVAASDATAGQAGDSPGLEQSRTVITEADQPVGWLDDDSRDVAVVRCGQSLFDAVDAMLGAHDDMAVVLDDDGQIVGGLQMSEILQYTHGEAGAQREPVTSATERQSS